MHTICLNIGDVYSDTPEWRVLSDRRQLANNLILEALLAVYCDRTVKVSTSMRSVEKASMATRLGAN